MDGDNKTALGIVIAIVIGIAAIIVVLTDYHDKKNKHIASAATCEAAVLIEGGAVEQKLLLCAIGKKVEIKQ